MAYKHLIDITRLCDRSQVFCLAPGVEISDLTNAEMKVMYLSEKYLAEKYQKQAAQLSAELKKFKPKIVRPRKVRHTTHTTRYR